MNAAKSQQILTRLYADAEYRNAFLLDKDAFYEAYEITDPETVAFLNAIKPEQLQFFSKGLYSKKYHEVLRIIPGTAYLLKSDIGALFKEFSRTPGSYGVHRYHEEALAFMSFICKKGNMAVEVKAMLKFEELVIRRFLHSKAWQISVFSYDVPDFLRVLHAGENPLMKKKTVLIIFIRGRIIKRVLFRRS